MNEQFQAKVIEYLDVLAKNLGVAVDYVFAMLVRQQIVEGVVYGSIWLIVLGACVAALVPYIKWAWKNADDDVDQLLFSLLLGLFITVIPIVLSLIFLPESIMKVVNPEYYALKTILDAVGGK